MDAARSEGPPASLQLSTSLIDQFVQKQAEETKISNENANVNGGRRVSARRKTKNLHKVGEGYGMEVVQKAVHPQPASQKRSSKSKDPNAPKRKRGRPRKHEVVVNQSSAPYALSNSSSVVSSVSAKADQASMSFHNGSMVGLPIYASLPTHLQQQHLQQMSVGMKIVGYPIHVTAGTVPPFSGHSSSQQGATNPLCTAYAPYHPLPPPTISIENGLTFEQFVGADTLPPTHLLKKPTTPVEGSDDANGFFSPSAADVLEESASTTNNNGISSNNDDSSSNNNNGINGVNPALHTLQATSSKVTRALSSSSNHELPPEPRQQSGTGVDGSSTISPEPSSACLNAAAGPPGASLPPPLEFKGDTPPHEWLMEVFTQRGYCTKSFCSLDTSYYVKPTAAQQASYGIKLVQLCRTNNLEECKKLMECGLSYNPCNRFGESIIHMACRRGNAELVKFLLDRGCDVQTCDDFGRTPLHDACWTNEPNFTLVEMLLGKDLRLLNITDCRGATPLAYVKRENWNKWKQFFASKVEIYWAPRDVEKDGEECVPALALMPPCSRDFQEPNNLLPVELAKELSGGTITPKIVKETATPEIMETKKPEEVLEMIKSRM